MPGLQRGLELARIDKKPGQYLQESTFSSFILSGTVSLVLILLAYSLKMPWGIGVTLFFLFFAFTLFYFLNKPQYNVIKAQRVIESEIVSAVRFLTLELKSERSLYNALANTSENFALIGIYFEEIIDKVKMGKTLEQALNEAVENCPSVQLRHIYWQLLNSIQTGADITNALHVQLEDIVESQKIRVQSYGQELNALSLFYMMISIIIPTVGFTIFTAVLTFIGFSITIGVLIGVWLLLTTVQYFFLMIASSRRPSVEAY